MSDKTEGTIDIASDAETILDVIGDLPAYPDWAEGVKAAEILETFPDGRCKVIRMEFASGPIKDTFVLEYKWNGVESVSWWLTEGKVLTKEDGTYSLTDNGDGSFNVRYELEVELSIKVPGILRRQAEKKMVQSALHGLKKRVESL
ncbi:MAG: SRPBCC family protein [Actinobacteria bacterium]|nr:SRPBCC family protein [Actinomycetota bacterium]